MKMFFFIVSFLVLSFSASNAQSCWSFELQGGEVYNLPMPLTIRQQGYPDIKLMARYYTDAFELPVYWDCRLSHWQKGKSWEFEVIHHKIYLDNTTSEVQKFNISHGFNMITVNRGFDQKIFQYRAGAGVVLTHPESKIRGKEVGSTGDDFDLGYSISGPILNLAIGKSYWLSRRLFINAEAKTTLAYAYVKVAQGHADVYSFVFHIVVGIGFDFIKSREE